MNNQENQLNQNISTIFDNAMSENVSANGAPRGSTSLDALRKNINHTQTQQPNNINEQNLKNNQNQDPNQYQFQKQEQPIKRIQQPIKRIQQPIKNIFKPIFKPKLKPKLKQVRQVEKNIQQKTTQKVKPKLKSKIIRKVHKNKINLNDISKKSIVAACLFIILSIPQFLNMITKFLPTKTITDSYKSLLLRALLFAILYVIILYYLN